MKKLLAGICTISMLLSLHIKTGAFYYNYGRVLTPPIWSGYNIDEELEYLSDFESSASDKLIPLDCDYVPKKQGDAMLPISSMGNISYENGKVKFTNYVDGYTLIIPGTMQTDMSMSDVGTLFTDEHRSLRIYKETFKTVSERTSYIEYSSRFLDNTDDHTLESRDYVIDGDYQLYITQWSRRPLSKVNRDKCYYACVDVCIGASVYTFFFTSDLPYYLSGDYMDIVRSFEAIKPTVSRENAYTKGYKKSSADNMSKSTQQTYNNLFSDSSSFKMGFFAPEAYGGYPAMEGFEQTIGYKFSTILVYTEFMEKQSVPSYTYALNFNKYISKIENNLKYSRKTGRSLELTIQTPLTPSGSSNMIYSILNGDYDIYLSAYAKMLNKYKDVTILFRPFNEMNCDWCNYSAYYTSRDPQVYVELYKYIYSKFKASGCNNLIWVWNPNEKSFPQYKWNSEQLYYPGDEYVDVYGITGYNTGTYYKGEIWRSFDEIYEPIYRRAERINEKPVMITEFSCSSDGGDKIAWIEDMFNNLYKYPKIKLAVWWHAADYDGSNIARPYFFDTPQGTVDVFKKYLN